MLGTSAKATASAALSPPQPASASAAAGSSFANRRFIRTIEWDMLDKRKYFPMSMVSSFTVRCFLYPLTVVRTRLQVAATGEGAYAGTWDALKKIVKFEGVAGLYRGFWISSVQVFSGVAYVSTYESVRHVLERQGVTDSKVKAFAGGGCASVVGQTIIVPFDVISQHLMILGQTTSRSTHKPADVNPLAIATENRSRREIVTDIVRTIYHRDGLRGFYRGYSAALCTYVPSSASWWTFYHLFQELYGMVLPAQVPLTALQCASAMSSGCVSCLLTNPLDLVRTNVQVKRETIPETARALWRDEGLKVFTKGLTARMSASVIYSVAIIFGYETVKRWSVKEKFRDSVQW